MHQVMRMKDGLLGLEISLWPWDPDRGGTLVKMAEGLVLVDMKNLNWIYILQPDPHISVHHL